MVAHLQDSSVCPYKYAAVVTGEQTARVDHLTHHTAQLAQRLS